LLNKEKTCEGRKKSTKGTFKDVSALSSGCVAIEEK
jgi:hypothetical protein